MQRRIALLHFSGPPGIGGVESILQQQALHLSQQGYAVRIIVGSGSDRISTIDHHIEPLLSSTHPRVLHVKAQLDTGHVTDDFRALERDILTALRAALTDCEVCIAHNVASLHKNLALTSALHTVAGEGAPRLIAWCHDLAWTNTQYRAELHPGAPWDLLRQRWANTRYVTISAARRDELATLLDMPDESIRVIGGGVDPASFLRLTPRVAALAKRFALWDADAILLYPTRLTRRKNIELALDILAALRRQTAQDIRLIITGPPGSHNPANATYLAELLARQHDLHLEDSAHFLYRFGEGDAPLLLGDADVAGCYALADALLMTTRQEGFGIPMLEAALAGIPIFCSDLPTLREIACDDAHTFSLQDDPTAIARAIWASLSASHPYALRRRVRQGYRWDSLIANELLPLLEG
jgi:glycosyltransferase involved in cell wall biosynthesis